MTYEKELKRNENLKKELERRRLSKENEGLERQVGKSNEEFVTDGFRDALERAGVTVKDIAKGERL